MRQRRVHTHPCTVCHVLFPCSGDLEENVDGWSEVVCDHFDKSFRRAERLCAECLEKDQIAYARDMAEQEADA